MAGKIEHHYIFAGQLTTEHRADGGTLEMTAIVEEDRLRFQITDDWHRFESLVLDRQEAQELISFLSQKWKRSHD